MKMTDEKRNALLEWVRSEGLDPADIVADGSFSVHNGKVSGYRFVRGQDGEPVLNRRRNEFVTAHFSQPQKNPLPEEAFK